MSKPIEPGSPGTVRSSPQGRPAAIAGLVMVGFCRVDEIRNDYINDIQYIVWYTYVSDIF